MEGEWRRSREADKEVGTVVQHIAVGVPKVRSSLHLAYLADDGLPS
jgi:hypothetical protein